jgi:hypothetical protein
MSDILVLLPFIAIPLLLLGIIAYCLVRQSNKKLDKKPKKGWKKSNDKPKQ